MGRKSECVYPGLRKLMEEQGLCMNAITQVLGIARNNASRKLRGKARLTLAEAFLIQKHFAPDRTIEELFGGKG